MVDNMFKCSSLNENVGNVIQMSLKFVPKGSIHNRSVLVKVMAWCRTGDKPLADSMLTQVTDAYMQPYGEMT